MSTIAFDTRRAVRNLKAAGISEAHADAIVDSMAEAFSETVATKTDIAVLKADMLKVAIGIVVANATLPFALIRFLS